MMVAVMPPVLSMCRRVRNVDGIQKIDTTSSHLNDVSDKRN